MTIVEHLKQLAALLPTLSDEEARKECIEEAHQLVRQLIMLVNFSPRG